jgi:hypothetical protein
LSEVDNAVAKANDENRRASQRIKELQGQVSQAGRDLKDAMAVLDRYERDQKTKLKSIEDDFVELTRALKEEIMAVNLIRKKRKMQLFEDPAEKVVAKLIAEGTLRDNVFQPIEEYLDSIVRH